MDEEQEQELRVLLRTWQVRQIGRIIPTAIVCAGRCIQNCGIAESLNSRDMRRQHEVLRYCIARWSIFAAKAVKE